MAQSISISGKIRDQKTNEVLIGATIYPQNDLKKGTVTNVNGDFELTLDKADLRQPFVVSYIGYERIEIDLSNSNNNLKIYLNPSETSLHEVVVFEDRLVSEEFRIDRIEQLDIYKNPIAKADPILAVNSLGYATTTDESANISLRGSSPDEGAIFFNNVPIYDAVKFAQLDGVGTFSIFNNAIIDNIEVYPSNPPIEYGGATSGLISLKTQNEQLPMKTLHSLIVSMVGSSYNINKSLKNEGFINAFVNTQHSYFLKVLNPDALRDLPYFTNSDLGFFYTTQLGLSNKVNFYNYSLTEGYEFIQAHPSALLKFDQSRWRNFSIVNFIRKLRRGALSLNLGFSYSNNDFSGGNLDLNTKNKDLYASLHYEIGFDKTMVKFGTSFDKRKQDISGLIPEFSYARDITHPTNAIAFGENIRNFETYGYLKHFFSEKLIGAVGLRKNIPLSNQPNYLSLQSNFNFKITSKMEFILSYGKYNKYEFNGIDNELKGRIESSQIALDAKLELKRSSLIAGIYGKKSSDASLKNDIYGFDASFEKFIGKKIKLLLSITSVNSEIRDEDRNKYPSEYDIDFFIRPGLLFESNSWSVSIISNHRSGVAYLPLTGTRFNEQLNVYEPEFASPMDYEHLPRYHIVNLALSKTFFISEKSNLIAFMNINNLFDRKNVRNLTYNYNYTTQKQLFLSRRLFFVGFNINFF